MPPEAYAIAIICGIACLAALVVSLITHGSQSPSAVARRPATATPIPSATPIPAVFPGPLDGLPTARAAALRRPIAVVIDNFAPDARPQSGLGAASVVYESLTEGGITRLLGIYLERQPRIVGPIRSARPYFVKWAAAYRALFVHGGGAPAALTLLKRTPQLGDMEALSSDPAFPRAASRSTPHNLYALPARVRALAARRHLKAHVSFTWMRHKSGASLSARGGRQRIIIDFSTPAIGSDAAYRVTYRYDRAINRYLRAVGGVPARDALNGRQLRASNVVVLFSHVVPIPNDPAGRVSVGAVGTGRALYFQDGHRIRGTWVKSGRLAPIKFLDGAHRPIAFNPGQTWIEAVTPGSVRVVQG